jgi:hypothetical protein
MDQPGPSNIGIVGQHPPQMIGTGQMASMPNQAMGGGKGPAENNSPLLVNLLRQVLQKGYLFGFSISHKLNLKR